MDPFDEYSTTLTSPYTAAMPIAPNDDSDLPVIGRAINFSGTPGITYPVTVTLLNDVVVTLSLETGQLHQLRVKRLHATGTDVNIAFVALW